MAAAIMTFLVKVIAAPFFFLRFIKKHRLQFSVSTYLNGPMTLIVLALLIAFPYSHFFKPLAAISPGNKDALLLSMSMIFVSIFLTVNRKGALSQMVGILSMENAIVSFAYVSGLETTAGAQAGILFIIFIWIIIASVFASMIYHYFGSLDVSKMKHLKEE
jgi:hydrogenase-4 component E